jgi:hypothetical protein
MPSATAWLLTPALAAQLQVCVRRRCLVVDLLVSCTRAVEGIAQAGADAGGHTCTALGKVRLDDTVRDQAGVGYAIGTAAHPSVSRQ